MGTSDALLGLGSFVIYVAIFATVVYFWQWIWQVMDLPDSPSMPIALTMVILTLVILLCGMLSHLNVAQGAN